MQSLYKRLGDTEVRLLTVAVHDGAVSSLELRTYPRAAAPEYDALSYTWGNDASTTSTPCNGLPLDIRTNLFTALPFICDFRPEPRTRPLWIDAICLNQKDEVEKEVQVASMGEIYENATRTLIWLGEAANNSDLAMDSIKNLTKKLLSVKDRGSLMIRQTLIKHDLPLPDDPIWKALKLLQLRPWIYRLWTFQEIVMSKEAVLLCGRKTITWDALVSLNQASNQAELSTLITAEADEDTPYRRSQHFISHVEALRSLRNKKDRITLPMLLLFSADRDYYLAVDRIWALVGILNKNYQRLIREAKMVNYGSDAISNYHESFLKMVMFHMKYDTALAMQLIEDSSRVLRNENLPSWCPDWHTDRGDLSLARWPEALAGIPGGEPRRIEPFMKANGNGSLEVCGLLVDVVERTTTSPGQGILDIASYPWLAECVDIIKSTPFVPYAVYPETAAIAPTPTTYVDGSPMNEHRQRYMRAENLLKYVLYPPGVLRKESSNTILRCNGRKFLRTKDSRLGIGPADLKANDLLCAMYGAKTIWALRPCGSGAAFQGLGADERSVQEIEEQEFELLGSVYTPSLLSGEAWVGVSCESMRRFKLR